MANVRAGMRSVNANVPAVFPGMSASCAFRTSVGTVSSTPFPSTKMRTPSVAVTAAVRVPSMTMLPCRPPHSSGIRSSVSRPVPLSARFRQGDLFFSQVHVWSTASATSTSKFRRLKSVFSAVTCSPFAPRASVPPTGAWRVRALSVFVRTMPAHAVAAPRDSVAGVSPSNTTTSFSPGTTPPVHAAAAVRSATPEALS